MTGDQAPISKAGADQPEPSQPDEPPSHSYESEPPLRRWFSALKARFSPSDTSSLRQDLQTILEEETAADGAFSNEELRMLRNIMALQETRVEDVMVPRADVIAVEEKTSLAELLVTFEGAGHSRLPVYRETLDDPLGMVHLKDLVSHMGAVARRSVGGQKSLEVSPGEITDLGMVDMTSQIKGLKLVRTVLFVPPSMPIIDLLVKMQTTRIHMALVVDEYGGTDGLVSIEDLVETVVGDIEDEHDIPEDQMILPQAGGVFHVDARAPIEDLAQALGISLEDEEAADEVDTVGGYVFYLIGRVPVRGELVPFNGDYEFEVLEADPRRIKKLKVQKRPKRAKKRDVPLKPATEEAKAASAPVAPSETSAPATTPVKKEVRKTKSGKVVPVKPVSKPRAQTKTAAVKKPAQPRTGTAAATRASASSSGRGKKAADA